MKSFPIRKCISCATRKPGPNSESSTYIPKVLVPTIKHFFHSYMFEYPSIVCIYYKIIMKYTRNAEIQRRNNKWMSGLQLYLLSQVPPYGHGTATKNHQAQSPLSQKHQHKINSLKFNASFTSCTWRSPCDSLIQFASALLPNNTDIGCHKTFIMQPC